VVFSTATLLTTLLRLRTLPIPLIISSGLAALAHAASSTYYFKYFSTSGSINAWHTNDNSWGVNAPAGTGFIVMVTGEDWGTWSPVHALPKKLNALSSSHNTWFSQKASPASGAGYDAWYGIDPKLPIHIV
jgi:hypothetical protein